MCDAQVERTRTGRHPSIPRLWRRALWRWFNQIAVVCSGGAGVEPAPPKHTTAGVWSASASASAAALGIITRKATARREGGGERRPAAQRGGRAATALGGCFGSIRMYYEEFLRVRRTSAGAGRTPVSGTAVGVAHERAGSEFYRYAQMAFGIRTRLISVLTGANIPRLEVVRGSPL